MKSKFIITFLVFLLILPAIMAQVNIRLGEPYVNIEDFSEIKFTSHPDYYEVCSLDETIIPVLISNNNKFSDVFRFEVNREYASLPVKSAVLTSGKSAVLPLTVSPPVDLEENTTLVLDIITEKERLKRSVVIKTNIKKCYLFELQIDKDKDEICGCDKEIYSLVLDNKGTYTDTFTLSLDIPEWVNSTLDNNTFELYDGQKREIKLEAGPDCEEKGVFNIYAEAISNKTKAALRAELELTVLPQQECYNTIIIADDLSIDYFGKNVPITIENKGIKDMAYSMSVEGVDWYSLSQTDFSLKPNNEKTINLALYPDENIVEGNYNIDIKAKSDEREFTKSITVKLRSKGTFFEKIKSYLIYFRYYIGLGVFILVIVLLLMVLVRKRVKRKKVKEEPEVEKRKEKVEKEVKKAEKKIIVKKAKKIAPWAKGLLFFSLYLIFLALLVLLTYSTFKYRSYYERALNFISVLFTKYVVPYGAYLRYIVLGIGVVVIIIAVIDFFRKKPKKKKGKKEKIKREEPREEKKEIKKISEKKVEKKKLKLFEYMYLILVVLLFLAIVVYLVYRLSGKHIPLERFKFITNFIQSYYLYFIIGIIILVFLIAIINFLKKKGKKTRKKVKEKKVLYPIVRAKPKLVKKISKKTKRLVKNIVIVIVGLAILSGIIYSFVYYNLISYIRDFLIVYYPYILMGVGILIILILILRFQSKKIS